MRESKSARFVFERQLIVCAPPKCRKGCPCKGAGFFYSLKKRHEALNREVLKNTPYKSIDVGGFESP